MAEDKLLQWRSLEFPDVSRENGGHVSNTHCLTVNDYTRVKHIMQNQLCYTVLQLFLCYNYSY